MVSTLSARQQKAFVTHANPSHNRPSACLLKNRVTTRHLLRSTTHKRPYVAPLQASAVPTTNAEGDTATASDPVAVLHRAAADASVPAADVVKAMRDSRRVAKPGESDWFKTLGGEVSPGKTWKLVFAAGNKEVQKANKGEKANGYYMPISAAQHWDGPSGRYSNGIYLGWLAALVFEGPIAWKGTKQLQFDVDTLSLRLGPAKTRFALGERKSSGRTPIFVFLYVDDKVCVAQGRSGGMALWANQGAEWDLSNGVVFPGATKA